MTDKNPNPPRFYASGNFRGSQVSRPNMGEPLRRANPNLGDPEGQPPVAIVRTPAAARDLVRQAQSQAERRARVNRRADHRANMQGQLQQLRDNNPLHGVWAVATTLVAGVVGLALATVRQVFRRNWGAAPAGGPALPGPEELTISLEAVRHLLDQTARALSIVRRYVGAGKGVRLTATDLTSLESLHRVLTAAEVRAVAGNRIAAKSLAPTISALTDLFSKINGLGFAATPLTLGRLAASSVQTNALVPAGNPSRVLTQGPGNRPASGAPEGPTAPATGPPRTEGEAPPLLPPEPAGEGGVTLEPAADPTGSIPPSATEGLRESGDSVESILPNAPGNMGFPMPEDFIFSVPVAAPADLAYDPSNVINPLGIGGGVHLVLLKSVYLALEAKVQTGAYGVLIPRLALGGRVEVTPQDLGRTLKSGFGVHGLLDLLTARGGVSLEKGFTGDRALGTYLRASGSLRLPKGLVTSLNLPSDTTVGMGFTRDHGIDDAPEAVSQFFFQSTLADSRPTLLPLVDQFWALNVPINPQAPEALASGKDLSANLSSKEVAKLVSLLQVSLVQDLLRQVQKGFEVTEGNLKDLKDQSKSTAVLLKTIAGPGERLKSLDQKFTRTQAGHEDCCQALTRRLDKLQPTRNQEDLPVDTLSDLVEALGTIASLLMLTRVASGLAVAGCVTASGLVYIVFLRAHLRTKTPGAQGASLLFLRLVAPAFPAALLLRLCGFVLGRKGLGKFLLAGDRVAGQLNSLPDTSVTAFLGQAVYGGMQALTLFVVGKLLLQFQNSNKGQMLLTGITLTATFLGNLSLRHWVNQEDLIDI